MVRFADLLQLLPVYKLSQRAHIEGLEKLFVQSYVHVATISATEESLLDQMVLYVQSQSGLQGSKT